MEFLKNHAGLLYVGNFKIKIFMNNQLSYIGRKLMGLYVDASYPLLPITKLSRLPLRWYYHQSPLLRHDSRFFLKPYLLHHFHHLLNGGQHPHDFMIHRNSLHFRSFGSVMSYQAYYVGEVEYHLMQYLVSQVCPNFVMLDIGAHHGAHTIIAAYELKKRGWNGVIHSFEPDPRNFELLKYNVEQNNLERYVKLYNQAVCEISEYQDLVVGSDNSCNFLKSSASHEVMMSPLVKNSPLTQVQTTRLDDLQDLGAISLIKMDIQGSEAYALRGAKNLIQKSRPIILFEAVKGFEYAAEVLSLLEEFGYVVRGVNRSGNLCGVDASEHFVSWDYVALPEEHLK